MNESNESNELTQERVNAFLNILRKSGITNMYGARPYIQEAFDVNKYDALRYLSVWMNDYDFERD